MGKASGSTRGSASGGSTFYPSSKNRYFSISEVRAYDDQDKKTWETIEAALSESSLMGDNPIGATKEAYEDIITNLKDYVSKMPHENRSTLKTEEEVHQYTQRISNLNSLIGGIGVYGLESFEYDRIKYLRTSAKVHRRLVGQEIYRMAKQVQRVVRDTLHHQANEYGRELSRRIK